MSLKLHHLNASRSQRLIWLLEELGVQYEVVHYLRDAETRLAPAELLNIHPMGKRLQNISSRNLMESTSSIHVMMMKDLVVILSGFMPLKEHLSCHFFLLFTQQVMGIKGVCLTKKWKLSAKKPDGL
jgi:hypothetical protein